MRLHDACTFKVKEYLNLDIHLHYEYFVPHNHTTLNKQYDFIIIRYILKNNLISSFMILQQDGKNTSILCTHNLC